MIKMKRAVCDAILAIPEGDVSAFSPVSHRKKCDHFRLATKAVEVNVYFKEDEIVTSISHKDFTIPDLQGVGVCVRDGKADILIFNDVSGAQVKVRVVE